MKQSTLREKRRAYSLALDEALQQIVAALARRPDVVRAILFGSYQKGRRDLFTDLDILIVVASGGQNVVARTAEMYRYLSAPVDMDLLVYTPEELAQSRDRPFVRRILERGEVIYEA
jgi:predicted nucleotidyltransferase